MKGQFDREQKLLSDAMRPSRAPVRTMPGGSPLWRSDIRRTHGVEVTAAAGGKLLAAASGEEAVAAFLAALCMDKWTAESPPGGARAKTHYTLCAMDIIQWAAGKCFTAVTRLACITRYAGRDIVSLEKGAQLACYAVPEETLRYLDGLAEDG